MGHRRFWRVSTYGKRATGGAAGVDDSGNTRPECGSKAW